MSYNLKYTHTNRSSKSIFILFVYFTNKNKFILIYDEREILMYCHISSRYVPNIEIDIIDYNFDNIVSRHDHILLIDCYHCMEQHIDSLIIYEVDFILKLVYKLKSIKHVYYGIIEIDQTLNHVRVSNKCWDMLKRQVICQMIPWKFSKTIVNINLNMFFVLFSMIWQELNGLS